jgi:hypothetical protein
MEGEWKLYLFSNEKHELLKPGITSRTASQRLPEYLREHPELPRKGWKLTTEIPLGTTLRITATLIEIAVKAVLIVAGATGVVAVAGAKGIHEVFKWRRGAALAKKLVEDEVALHMKGKTKSAKKLAKV